MAVFNYKPIRLIELFAGIGSQAKALTNLGADFEHWRVCELDKHAVNAYNAVHSTQFVTSDITKINAADLGINNTDRFTYLLTYSFPCQDLSSAGKGAGMEKGSGTRSGLLWEVERLLNECTELPQVLLMENVPQVHGKKNLEHFNRWIAFLESKGYSNHWQDLNSKDYGVPQSRKRCYMVSILGEHSFVFPKAVPLDRKLKDVLEAHVDEKYYLSGRILEFFTKNSEIQKAKGNGFRFSPTDGDCIAKTITTRAGSRMDDNFIKEEPLVWDGYNQRLRADQSCVGTLRTNCGGELLRTAQGIIETPDRVRKLTEKECWRLMGFDDADVEKAAKVCSPTQLYKQAGNSIVVDVLMAIFKELLTTLSTHEGEAFSHLLTMNDVEEDDTWML